MATKATPTIQWSVARLMEVLKSVWKPQKEKGDGTWPHYDYEYRIQNLHELPKFWDSTEPFPNCCAFDVYFDLKVPPQSQGWTENQHLAALALRWKLDGEESGGAAPFGLVATGQGQDEVNRLLAKLGFEKLGRTVVNPNHGSRVTLWRGKILQRQ